MTPTRRGDPSSAVPMMPRTSTASGAPSSTRWAVAVLVLATLVLALYLTLVVAAAGLAVSFAAAIGLVDRVPPLDVGGMLTEVSPGVLAGWAVGLVAAQFLGSGSALGHRAAGATAGALGCVIGAAVLRATGVL